MYFFENFPIGMCQGAQTPIYTEYVRMRIVLIPYNSLSRVIIGVRAKHSLEPPPVRKHELATMTTCAPFCPCTCVRHWMRTFPAHSRKTLQQTSPPFSRGHVEEVSVNAIQHPLAVKKIVLPVSDVAASICETLLAFAGPYSTLKCPNKFVERVGALENAVVAVEVPS